jgi:hypothetical protein
VFRNPHVCLSYYSKNFILAKAFDTFLVCFLFFPFPVSSSRFISERERKITRFFYFSKTFATFFYFFFSLIFRCYASGEAGAKILPFFYPPNFISLFLKYFFGAFSVSGSSFVPSSRSHSNFTFLVSLSLQSVKNVAVCFSGCKSNPLFLTSKLFSKFF